MNLTTTVNKNINNKTPLSQEMLQCGETQVFSTNNYEIEQDSEKSFIEDNLLRIEKEMGDKLNEVELRLLVKLVENSGKVVTRSDLIESSWGGRVVTGSSLNVAIKKIRDASKSTTLEGKIVTLPKRGYMFTTGEVYTKDIENNASTNGSYVTNVKTNDRININSKTSTGLFKYWLSSLNFFVSKTQAIVNLISLILWQTSFVGFLFLWWPE